MTSFERIPLRTSRRRRPPFSSTSEVDVTNPTTASTTLGLGNSVVLSSGLVSVLSSSGSSITSVSSFGSLVFNSLTAGVLSSPGSTTGFLTLATSSFGLATGSSTLVTFGAGADPPPPPPPPIANADVDNATINPNTTARTIPVRKSPNGLFVSWLVIFILNLLNGLLYESPSRRRPVTR